jgi:uncharacterized protein YbjT (DUF2867 family)
MQTPELNVVTGAFSHTGRYIAQRLLDTGKQVRTLTGRPGLPNPFPGRVEAHPFNFDNPERLIESLRGATTLYNTYWVRFPHGDITHELAVENTKILINAAREAGVRRIVHLSITNPSQESASSYFRGKAILERHIIDSGLSYAIVRPTVIFGPEGTLINNIAWLLRRFPLFAVFGRGEYLIQPVFIEDLADLVVSVGQGDENAIIDAVGPETFTFDELVRLIAAAVHSRAKIIHVNPGLALLLSKLIGYAVRDVLVTGDEMKDLMANLLVSNGSPTGETRLSEWLERNAETVGTRYISELRTHYR